MTLLRPKFLASAVLAACLAHGSFAQAATAAGAGTAGTAGMSTAGTPGTTGTASSSNTNPLAASTNTPSATTTPTGSNLVSGGDAFSGSSRGPVPPVGPAAVDANGVNVSGFGTGLQSGATTSAGVNGAAVTGNAAATGNAANNTYNPATGTFNSPFSSDVGTGVIYPGAPYGITDTTGMTSGTTPGTTGGGSAGNAYATPAANAPAGNATSFTASGIATPQLDAATRREARRERATVARGGQTLDTIAPRTNVDRSNEMPDDPPSPALRTPDRPVVRY